MCEENCGDCVEKGFERARVEVECLGTVIASEGQSDEE